MVEELDIRGLVCPMTVIKVLQRVKSLKTDAILIVLTDSETATKSIPKEMAKKELDCEVENISPGEWKLTIRGR